jgi:two-component system NtrC family sensor kinase
VRAHLMPARSRNLSSILSPAGLLAESRLTASRIVLAMVSVIALLGVLAYVDQQHETQAALADFAAEQVMIARAATSALGQSDATPTSLPPGTASDPFTEIASRLRALEQPSRVLVFLGRPGETIARSLDGEPVHSEPLQSLFRAVASAQPWVRLSHEESEEVGLPPRTSVAGIAELHYLAATPWHVVIVASARHERDREERGLWRTALGFVLASATVIVFGALALRIQRKELDLARELVFAEQLRERDEKLVRADKLATLGAMAMGIAHQLATPLGVIVARADRLASRVEGDDKAVRAVKIISEQADRIHVIVRSFLQVARGGPPALEHVEPRALVEATMDLVSHRFADANVHLSSSIEESCPTIACDPRLFEQALVNLLLNACDACSSGGNVSLSVRVVSPVAGAVPGAKIVSFAVDDDGVGISPEVRARATEPFFTTKPPDTGTGLGLAIAQEIAHHHAGELHLEPRPAGGTRATLEVPALGEAAT